jgi:hypothetical protein
MKNANNSKNDAVTSPPANRTITRSQANEMLRVRAGDLYHQARATREENIRAWEGEHGRCDRIDQSLLRDVERLQARFAAVAARQARSSYGEPKVSKYVEQLGTMMGSLSAHLATERAMELFAPVDESTYLGYGNKIGEKGLDESVLAGYEIVDDKRGAIGAAPTRDDEGGVCLHERIEPYEDPASGACVDCGEEFPLRVPPAEEQEAA